MKLFSRKSDLEGFLKENRGLFTVFAAGATTAAATALYTQSLFEKLHSQSATKEQIYELNERIEKLETDLNKTNPMMRSFNYPTNDIMDSPSTESDGTGSWTSSNFHDSEDGPPTFL